MNAQQSRVAELLKNLMGWEHTVLFPLVDIGIDILFNDLVHGAHNFVMAIGINIHVGFSCFWP